MTDTYPPTTDQTPPPPEGEGTAALARQSPEGVQIESAAMARTPEGEITPEIQRQLDTQQRVKEALEERAQAVWTEDERTGRAALQACFPPDQELNLEQNRVLLEATINADRQRIEARTKLEEEQAAARMEGLTPIMRKRLEAEQGAAENSEPAPSPTGGTLVQQAPA